MTVIQQKVLVPETRRITLDLPGDVPAGGMADVVVTISASQKEQHVPPKKRIGILAGKLHIRRILTLLCRTTFCERSKGRSDAFSS